MQIRSLLASNFFENYVSFEEVCLILGQVSSMISSEFSKLPASSYKSNDFVVCCYYFFFSFAVRFQVFYTISQPTPEWDGYEGRVSMEMLLEILPPPPSAGHERELLIAVCGPDAFTQHMVR